MKTTKTVGLIGYGRLGKALTAKIQEKTDTHVLISKGADTNEEVAHASDILFLTVKPKKVEEVMERIRHALRETTIVISFAAVVEKERIAQDVSNAVLRAMADIDFEQVIAESHESANDLLTSIGSNSLMQTDREEIIDRFTILEACLPGVAAWQLAHNVDAEKWLAEYARFIEKTIGVPASVCQKIYDNVRKNQNFEEKIKEVATKGGITEALIAALITEPNCDFTQLLKVGEARMEEVRKNMIQKNS